jgi:hypothetical protein
MIDSREPDFRILVVQHVLSPLIQNGGTELINHPLKAGADVDRANLLGNHPKGIGHRFRSRDA